MSPSDYHHGSVKSGDGDLGFVSGGEVEFVLGGKSM